MKHIRKFFQTVMVMALAICLTSMPVMAQEVTDYDVGMVKFTPVGSGTVKEFGFTNLSGEYKTFDLSELTPGTYQVRVYAYAFGTSNKATAYYKMNY